LGYISAIFHKLIWSRWKSAAAYFFLLILHLRVSVRPFFLGGLSLNSRRQQPCFTVALMPKSRAQSSDAATQKGEVCDQTPPLKGLVHTNPHLAENFLR
jgi:hypothetical protein